MRIPTVVLMAFAFHEPVPDLEESALQPRGLTEKAVW
jgi:hypothetical protein